MLAVPAQAAASKSDLLDVLLENGSISQEQYESLANEGAPKAGESSEADGDEEPPLAAVADDDSSDDDEEVPEDDKRLNERIADAVAKKIEEEFPVKASYGSKGFRLETRDGKWQTNLQWRFQFRLTHPYGGDPRQVDDFYDRDKTNFQARRIRMKIGGHGYQPWLKYYFEVDLQPTRDADDSSATANSRLIDARLDVAKYKQFAIRVGQWKVDYNRERVDSSGRQEFVERSIVNRIFTIDRQVGVSLRGHLFEGTPADMKYYAGVFSGEGRGVSNDDNNLMFVSRLQWNFLGRDLGMRQTDVERTEKPTGSLAAGYASHTGVCTRWSSSGCGNLDGFQRSSRADQGQYRIHQAVQELAYKHQGFSLQQEFHWKQVLDRNLSNGDPDHKTNLYGLYAQTGYFFNEIFEAVPEELELAFRYAFVREPNKDDRQEENFRQEYTVAANWFFAGHNNKITVDYSYLTLDDDVRRANVADHRMRLQWDISF
jgi:hypothetical protein